MALIPSNLDEVFYRSYMNIPKQFENELPASIASTRVPHTAYTFGKLDLNKGSADSGSSRIIDHYPAAYKDFYGMPSGTPCIYKSGPAWPEHEGPEA